MGLTIYLLDKQRSLKRAISRGIAELIHSEGDKTLQAEIAIGYRPHSGEYIAFRCVDGRHRLFEIDVVDQLDEEGVDYIEAVDASVAELRSTIATEAAVKNKNADAAMRALLAGTGWTIGKVEANGYVGNIRDAEFEPIADVMERIADTAEVKLEPYYELSNGKVTAKKIDILSREPVYRGLVVSRRNASGIILTEQGAPMGRVYAIGGWTGTGEERKRVTLESVAWSAAAGDQVDKPAGQKYIDLPGWQESYRRSFVYTDTSTEDPLTLAQDAYKELQKRGETKRTGTATAGDLSFLDGYHHSAVRVDDYAALRTQTGVVRERVANINRDYVRPELTELEFGERQSQSWIQTEYKQQQYQTEQSISSLQTGQARLRGGYSSLSQTVEDNGAELYRAIEELVELEQGTATRFNEVWIDLDAQEAKIELNASSVTKLGEDVSTAQAQLIVQAGQISTKVSRDGVVSAINQTPETILIQAKRINLSGYVTASQLSAEIASISQFFSGVAEASVLKATMVNCTGTMLYKDTAVSWKEKSVATGVNITQEKNIVSVKDTNGNTVVINYVTSVSANPTKSTISYLGN